MISEQREPLVGVVVLAYNGGLMLDQALRSVIEQSYPNTVVFVVDNASVDNAVSRASDAYAQMTFIRNETNRGFSGGMNVGIRAALAAGADYVWLFNQDAVAESTALERLVAAAEKSPRIGAVSPIIRENKGAVWFAGGRIRFGLMRAVHTTVPRSVSPYRTEFLSGCALMIRQKIFETVGVLDEDYFLYYEDADLSVRIRTAGFDVLVVPTAVVRHLESSLEQPAEKAYWLVRSGIRFFRKNSPTAWKLWHMIFLPLRRLKNRLDLCIHSTETARAVNRAYDDARKECE